MLAKDAADFARVDVAVADSTLEVARDDQGLGVVEGEAVDGGLVELNLLVARLDDLEAVLLDGGPDADGLVGAAAHDLLAPVVLRELGHRHLILVAAEAGQVVARGPVHEPDHKVLTAADESISLGVPVHEEDVIFGVGPVLEHALELELAGLGLGVGIVLELPNPNLVVHAARDAELPVVVELDELHSLSVTLQLSGLHALVLHDALALGVFILLLLIFLPSPRPDAPQEAFVVAVPANEGVEWLLGHLGDAVDVVLVDEAELADVVALDVEVLLNHLALAVQVLIVGSDIGLLHGSEVVVALPIHEVVHLVEVLQKLVLHVLDVLLLVELLGGLLGVVLVLRRHLLVLVLV
mmetsp:Transcript_2705/g.4590  ORF Transcript_2705/g.4590 Transcript_2705/m.4590 type:complete len:353 (-) Transcript_2705:47-1105(-)